jgi:hypothetical protein
MIQQIIAYSIIALAAGFAIYRIISAFRKKNDPCHGCASDCNSCAVVDLKKEIEKRKRKKK